jgi:5-methylcytosine-specific restriction endonuclease McrA
MEDGSRPPLIEESRTLAAISDDDLLLRLAAILAQSRRVEADLVAHIGEVDARRLYAREAAPSMFEYCTRILHLSEHEAYVRIAVARCCRSYPLALAMLRDGQLHLSGIARLAPHLGPDNAEALLMRSTHRSKRQIEDLLAETAPRPDARTIVRKLPERRAEAHRPLETQLGPERVESLELNGELASPLVAAPGPAPCPGPGPALEMAPAPTSRARIEPLGPARYKVQFTASAGLRDKLERLQALMRSSVPDGDLATVIERAVTEKIERLEARRFARVKAPRHSLAEALTTTTSRHIPAAVRRAVHARDGGRCVYRDVHGRRCPELHDLEFHHRIPFGRGGNHNAAGLCLMCRAHNALMAENDYGRETMGRFRRPASATGPGSREPAVTARPHRADS